MACHYAPANTAAAAHLPLPPPPPPSASALFLSGRKRRDMETPLRSAVFPPRLAQCPPAPQELFRHVSCRTGGDARRLTRDVLDDLLRLSVFDLSPRSVSVDAAEAKLTRGDDCFKAFSSVRVVSVINFSNLMSRFIARLLGCLVKMAAKRLKVLL